MQTSRYIFGFILLMLLSLYSDAKGNKKFYVADRKINCAGSYKCLQLKSKAKETWHIYPDSIGSFKYEEGNEYKILVKPIQTAGSFAGLYEEKYELVKVISKRKTTYNPAGGFENKKWILHTITEAGRTQTIKDSLSFVKISEANKTITGRAACNTFSADLTLQGNHISIGTIRATKMMCPNIELERTIFNFLSKVNSYIIRENTLTLLQSDGSKMVFTAQ